MRPIKLTRRTTFRDSKGIEFYLQEIKAIPRIEKDEELLLIQKIKQGDVLATERLIKGNLRYVFSIAKQYQNYGLPISDLISQGNLGLIKAVERFDETKGFKFITYAVWWVRQSILQSLSEHAYTVRLPHVKNNLLLRMKKAFPRLEQDFGREPSPLELATFLETTSSEIEELVLFTKNQILLSSPVSSDEDALIFEETLVGSVPRYTTEPKVFSVDAHRIFTKLFTKQQCRVLALHFGLAIGEIPVQEKELVAKNNEGFTDLEIAKIMNVTPQRVQQLRTVGLNKMRKNPHVFDILRPYWEQFSVN